MRKSIIVAICLLFVGGLFILFFGVYQSEQVPNYRVAYMGSPEYSPFWDRLGQSIVNVGEERNFLIDDYTPFGKAEETKEIMADRILRGDYDAIILGIGSDENFSSAFLKNLNDFQIPVFTIDTRIDDDYIVGFVATDNYGSGKIVGEYIYENIKINEEVLIVAANMIHGDSIERAMGAEEILKNKGIGVKILDANSESWDSEEIKGVVREELEGNQNYSAIFVVWDEGIISVRDLVEEVYVNNDLIYVGFDGLDFILREIDEGKISATIMQSTDLMADTTFNQISSYLGGEKYKDEILIPGILIVGGNVRNYL